MSVNGPISSRLNEAGIRGHEDVVSSQKGLQDAKQRDLMPVSRQADLYRVNAIVY